MDRVNSIFWVIRASVLRPDRVGFSSSVVVHHMVARLKLGLRRDGPSSERSWHVIFPGGAVNRSKDSRPLLTGLRLVTSRAMPTNQRKIPAPHLRQ